jgi:hypothetical protein
VVVPELLGELVVESWSAGAAAAWNDAWTSSFAADRVGAARTAAYVDWRYRSHPRFDYDVRVARSPDGPAVGLLVQRLDPLNIGTRFFESSTSSGRRKQPHALPQTPSSADLQRVPRSPTFTVRRRRMPPSLRAPASSVRTICPSGRRPAYTRSSGPADR